MNYLAARPTMSRWSSSPRVVRNSADF
jgi:hypothetical protein